MVIRRLESLMGDWGSEEFADFVAGTQVIFEELTAEVGAEVVLPVINRLRNRFIGA
jgi:hypothetical protein